MEMEQWQYLGAAQSRSNNRPGCCFYLGVLIIIIERYLFGSGFDINDYEIVAQLDHDIIYKKVEYEHKQAAYLSSKG